MKKLISVSMIVAALMGLCSCGGNKEEPVDWKTSFAEAGFTEDEIAGYEELFSTIGVTEFHDVTIVDNSPMHIITGKIYDSGDLQLNVTLENREIIYVGLAGIPDTKTEAYINWRGKLKTKTVDTKITVDMFSDTEGGYLAVLDWKNKTISEYEG